MRRELSEKIEALEQFKAFRENAYWIDMALSYTYHGNNDRPRRHYAVTVRLDGGQNNDAILAVIQKQLKNDIRRLAKHIKDCKARDAANPT